MAESVIRVAILYQSNKAPVINGIIKPMKPGGYADGGADIAFALKEKNINVVTPVENPTTERNLDWVFPDTESGIQLAISKGANTLWLNTVLYKKHPITKYSKANIYVVGQDPASADIYDDKWITNSILRNNKLPVPDSILISRDVEILPELNFPPPYVLKPVRGRGSTGVYLTSTTNELSKKIKEMFDGNEYGKSLYIEPYLPGQELTITVMPPGFYIFSEKKQHLNGFWSLPAVKRFNHINGLAPYNGTVAVVNNSAVLSNTEENSQNIQLLYKKCELAAKIVNAKAPIRIDCRMDHEGNYYLFDLNMKPNMTGSSRPHRIDQNSLSVLAAKKIGWDYKNFMVNVLNQRWALK